MDESNFKAWAEMHKELLNEVLLPLGLLIALVISCWGASQ